MPTYQYKVKNTDGTLEEGKTTAEDRFSLSNEMRNAGKSVISIEEIKEKKGLFSKSSSFVLFSRIKLHDKILFMRNLSSMIEAGLPLSRALSVLERQTRNVGFKNVIHGLLEGVTKGQALSDSLAKHAKHFSSLEVSMIRVGEESGNLAQSLETIATQMDKTYSLRKKIKGAMIYPGIIMSVMLTVGVLMFIFVVPTLMATFKDLDVELPASTKVVIFVSDIMKEHAILVIGGLIGFFVGIFLLGKTAKGKRFFDFVSLHVPMVSTMVKEYNTAQATRTLSSLLSSGVGVVESIAIAQEVVQNSYYKAVLTQSMSDVQKGVALSESFVRNEKLYPAIAGEMIQVGEETGQLSAMLQKVADYYEEEVDTKTKDLSTVIEPFLMVFIGAGVGFFAVSMLSPMYSLVNNI